MAAPKGHEPYNLKGEGGRPTKLTEEAMALADGYLAWCEANPISVKDESKPRCPTIAGLASHVKVGKRTVYDWAEANKRFSQVLDDVRREAEKILCEQGLIGNFNPLMAKFLLSADHDKREKSDLTTAGKELPTPIITVER